MTSGWLPTLRGPRRLTRRPPLSDLVLTQIHFDGTVPPASLRLEEAVPLGYVLMERVALEAGVRSLAIKGPTLERLGLREPHVSTDVDILVDPSGRDHLLGRLRALGWDRRIVSTTAAVIESHSVTLSHGQWPVQIDVHDRFPGLLAAPDVCFEALWRRRTAVIVAGRPVTALQTDAAAAIAALHYLRNPSRQVDFDELSRRLTTVLDDRGRDNLSALAAETASTQTLAPLLDRLGIHERPHVHAEAVTSVEDWRTVQASTGVHSVAWVAELRREPLRAWPAILKRALLLTDAEIRVWYPEAAPGWRGRWWGRLKRLCVGLAGVPRAVLIVRRHGPKA